MSVKNISSLNAYDLMARDENSFIVDVRTDEEWQKVGIPKLDNNKIFFISWRLAPDMSLNNKFEMQFMSNIGNKHANVLFLCRSGARSLEAARFAASLGYANCYNIFDGFEGNSFEAGWKQNNLPWQAL